MNGSFVNFNKIFTLKKLKKNRPQKFLQNVYGFKLPFFNYNTWNQLSPFNKLISYKDKYTVCTAVTIINGTLTKK